MDPFLSWKLGWGGKDLEAIQKWRSRNYFDWDAAKDAKLRAERGIGFEDVVFHIERGNLVDVLSA